MSASLHAGHTRQKTIHRPSMSLTMTYRFATRSSCCCQRSESTSEPTCRSRSFSTRTRMMAPAALCSMFAFPASAASNFRPGVKGLGIRLPVVLITGYSDVQMSVQAMKAGAVDFLPKPFRDQDMIDAVMAAIERDWQRRAADRAAADFLARFENLSSRERQVMKLVTAGKMNKQVAFELGLAEITVKTYRGAVMQKMAARSFADLVRMAEALETSGGPAAKPGGTMQPAPQDT